MRYHYIPIQTTEISKKSKTCNIDSWQGYGETGYLLVLGMFRHIRICLIVFIKLNMYLS